MKLFPLLLLLLGGGCQNLNGLFEISPEDCVVFTGDADAEVRVADSRVDGQVYIRRGTCNAEDRTAASRKAS